MAVDITANGTAARHARVNDSLLNTYISAFSVRETAAAAAVVKIRDSFAVVAPSALADGAAGLVTAGFHDVAFTAVTIYGESIIGGASGAFLGFTSAGTKHVTVTLPPEPGAYGNPATEFAGLNIYVTKAGAPATGITPTRAQWFLVVANPATTIAAGSNALPLPQPSIVIASNAGFAAAGRAIVTTSFGPEIVTYTSTDATHLLGCAGGRGVMATGGAVTQPSIPDTTSTTFDWNVADASLTATNPPAIDTSGSRLDEVAFIAAQATPFTSRDYANAKGLRNGGGLYVEVTSGAVTWEVSGA
jgi:hypothetical protein